MESYWHLWNSIPKATYLSHSRTIKADRQYLTQLLWTFNDWSSLYDTTYSQGIFDSFPLDGMDDCTCQLSFKPDNLENPLRIEFSDSTRFLTMKMIIFINNVLQSQSCYSQPVPTIIRPSQLKIPLEKFELNDILKSNSGNRSDKTLYIRVNFFITKCPPLIQSLSCQKPLTEAAQIMKVMFENKKLSDVTFVFGDKELPAHKAVLAVHSEVFEAMFSSEMNEKNTSKVEIVDTNAEIFEEFLKYLYIGELNDLKNKAEEMLLLADKYQVCKLKELCENFFETNICKENVVEYLLVADKYHCTALKKKALATLQNSANALKQAIMNENFETLMILKAMFTKNCSPKKE